MKKQNRFIKLLASTAILILMLSFIPSIYAPPANDNQEYWPPFTSFWHLSFTELYDAFAILDMTETITPLYPPDESRSKMSKTIPSSERYFGF